jgi:hypothetical protein
MADNYLEFSEIIDDLTPDEEAWLETQMEEVCLADGREVGDEDEDSEVDWIGPRFLSGRRDMYESDEGLGFEWQFETDRAKNTRRLWVYAEMNGDPNRLAHLVQDFLVVHRPKSHWSLTWAITCSKPRIGEFGGGGVFITADRMDWDDAHGFVEGRLKAFLA